MYVLNFMLAYFLYNLIYILVKCDVNISFRSGFGSYVINNPNKGEFLQLFFFFFLSSYLGQYKIELNLSVQFCIGLNRKMQATV